MRRAAAWIGACALLLSLSSAAASAEADLAPAASCTFSEADQAWVDQSLAARRAVGSEIGTKAFAAPITIVFFDAACVRRSDNVTADQSLVWTSAPHSGEIPIPDGARIPAGVTSFAGDSNGTAFFVMSTPSLWRANGVPGGPMGLENLMTAVLLHESAHVAQFPTYMRRVSAIAERQKLPESFNDDSIQDRFRSDTDYSAAVARETQALYDAATAKTDKEARCLAREALGLIAARRARWFIGGDAYLAETEDLFLSLEGSGQWVGYHWLTAKDGAGMAQADAITAFGRRGGWWTQDEGLALVLAAERIGGTGWRAQAFGAGKVAGIGMLEQALAPSQHAREKPIRKGPRRARPGLSGPCT